jgi:hypothetical protein
VVQILFLGVKDGNCLQNYKPLINGVGFLVGPDL